MLEKDKIFVSFQETNEGGVPIWPEFSDEIKDILNKKKKSNDVLGNQLRKKISDIQEKFGTMGVRWDRKRNVVSFRLSNSLYADDAGLLFKSRNILTDMMRYTYKHFLRFGLLIHVGRDGSKSKTEFMYFAGNGNNEVINLSPITITDDGGYITACELFPYLGSQFSHSLRDSIDVKHRIKKASKAFGTIRKEIFANRQIKEEAKVKIYLKLIVPILLYGSETWQLLKSDQDKLEYFHRKMFTHYL